MSEHLSRFIQRYQFPLDQFQLEGCQALEAGDSVLVAAPTGAGKTVVGEFAVHLGLAQGKRTFYTTPIKALSNQKYLDLCQEYGSDNVGLLTGDSAINSHASVVVMTTEVLRNMLYSGSHAVDELGYVVMDEVHYLADRFRGPVWEEVIIHLPAQVRVVALSATVSNAEEFGAWLDNVRGRTAVVVSEHRPVPLTQHMMVGKRLFDLYTADSAQSSNPNITPKLQRAMQEAQQAANNRDKNRNKRQGRRGSNHVTRLRAPSRFSVIKALDTAALLPAIIFVFSRAGCENAVAQALAADVCLTSPQEAERIRLIVERSVAALPQQDLEVLGYRSWLSALERGIAAHHAGMLPVFKETVEELFSEGLVKVVYATETLALGINMPARTVVLESLHKWNGSAHVSLTPGEYTQLTGRAGRRGIDTEGHAVVLAADEASPKQVSSLASRRMYPLHSAFKPTYNMAVNLLGHSTRARAREVLESSFAQFQADRGVVELAAQVRQKRTELAELESAMHCDSGNFLQYAQLRRDISDAEADLSRQRSRLKQQQAGKYMNALRRGDVVIHRRGRKQRYSLVLAVGQNYADSPELTVLGTDAKVRTLNPQTTPEGITLVGRMRVSERFSPRKSRDREALADVLFARVEEGTLQAEMPEKRHRKRTHAGKLVERDKQNQSVHYEVRKAKELSQRVEYLREQLHSHPCHKCSQREEHARVGRKWIKTKAELDRLTRQIEGRTGSVSRTFDAVCKVLLELGYLELQQPQNAQGDLLVTDAGKMLAKIYGERDLLIAECLRKKVWEQLSPPELAGAVSACVYEPRAGAASYRPSLGSSELTSVLRHMHQLSRRIEDMEHRSHLETSARSESALAFPVAAWAAGEELKEVLASAELTAGDFVRWCKQLIEALHQIANLDVGEDTALTSLVANAATARELVSRGAVAWSAL